MHPTLTFDLIQQDHGERIETARLLSQVQERRADARPGSRQPGHPPEPRPRTRVRSFLSATTTVAAAR
jgi:hypothetical protein